MEMNSDVFKAMQEGKPFATYIKTILGKVYITRLEPFGGLPEGHILSGDPRKFDENSMVDVWNQKEDAFLKKANKEHFVKGILIRYERPEEIVVERNIEEFSDEELIHVINQRFLGLQAALNKTESSAVLFRLANLARENEKSEKIIAAIENRLAEVQVKE